VVVETELINKPYKKCLKLKAFSVFRNKTCMQNLKDGYLPVVVLIELACKTLTRNFASKYLQW
jgi:hypothetical protein